MNPSMHSCVDITASSMNHYTRTISKYIRTSKEVRQKLTDTTWIHLLSGTAYTFVDSACCAKVPHPQLYCSNGSSRRIPLFIPWKYIHGTCDNWGLKKKRKLEEYEMLTQCSQEIDLLEWKNIPR